MCSLQGVSTDGLQPRYGLHMRLASALLLGLDTQAKEATLKLLLGKADFSFDSLTWFFHRSCR